MPRPQGSLIDLGDGRWIVRLTLGGLNAKGQRERLTRTVRGTKREASRVLNDWLKKKDDGLLTRVCRQTLDQWREEWLSTWCSELSPRTLHDYRTDLERYLTSELRTRRITALTPSDLQAWINQLRGRGLPPRTIRKVHAALRACLSKATRLGKTARNVAQLVELLSRFSGNVTRVIVG